MELKTTIIDGRTWAIEDGGVRFFVAAGTDRALMIDSGMTGLDVRAAAAELTSLPVDLVNTHGDLDHVAGNRGFSSFYMHPSEAPVYHHGPAGTGTILPVFEGDTFELGGRTLEVIHVPGHTPGSITLLDREARYLIGGDPVQEDGGIYMFGPYRDMEAYCLGLAHLLEYADAFDVVYPSHAKMPVDKEVIGKLLAGAEDILSGKIPGEPAELHGFPILTYDIGVCRFFCDRMGKE